MIRASQLHGLSSTQAASASSSASSSEVNKFNRPYPWYCSVVGWTGLDEECTPKSVDQINNEADAWLRQKVAEGKLDPKLAEEGIERSRADVAALCANEPGACEMLDAYANSPKCAALLPAELCNTFGSDGMFFGVAAGAAALILVLALRR